MKHKLFTIAALAASALVISCQQEENGPAQLEIVKTEELSLVLGDAPKSKVTVDGTTGEIAWNNGTDKIAVYVQGTGANEFQEKTVTDDAISVPLASGQSRAYFAVYPAASAVTGKYGGTGDHFLAVQYPTSYDLTGMTVAEIETFSPVPMVADNTGSDALTFYHVGGLLRLSVAQTPKTTTEMVVTFTGVPVTGTWRVTGGGTTAATLSNPTGTGNVVTYTMDALTSDYQTVTLNVPIPQGSYTGLTAIRVDAKAGSTTLASYTYSVTPAWSSVTRALGRKEALSFAAATLEITSTAATIWKGLSTTYTTNSDATVTWTSSNTSVATVNSSGVVTAVSAGTANIYAHMNNGLVDSDPVAVYVNEVTGVTLAPATAKVNKDVTIPLKATITINDNNPVNGTITSYPFDLTFSLNSYSYVRFNNSSGNASVTVTPVFATSTTATAVVNAYGYALDGTAATMTVSVPEEVFSGSTRTATASVSCELCTSISFPDWNEDGDPDGEPFKFRGYWIHPGFLFMDDSTPTPKYSIAGADDPLFILQHYWYDAQATKFDGTTGTAWTNRCFFTWDELDALDGSTNSAVTYTLNLKDAYGNHIWHIPSAGENTGEWYYILNNTPSSKIKINSTEYPTSENTANLVYVNVSLADATKANGAPQDYNGKGLGYSTDWHYYTWEAEGESAYQAGILMVPDGAYIYCAAIKSVRGTSQGISSSDNVITYEDLKILTDGGCIFLPRAGVYYSPKFVGGGRDALYWSATPKDTYGWSLASGSDDVNIQAFNATWYLPVCLFSN